MPEESAVFLWSFKKLLSVICNIIMIKHDINIQKRVDLSREDRREDRSLERIVKKSRFKNSRKLHKGWTEAGVKSVAHRRVQEMSYKC